MSWTSHTLSTQAPLLRWDLTPCVSPCADKAKQIFCITLDFQLNSNEAANSWRFLLWLQRTMCAPVPVDSFTLSWKSLFALHLQESQLFPAKTWPAVDVTDWKLIERCRTQLHLQAVLCMYGPAPLSPKISLALDLSCSGFELVFYPAVGSEFSLSSSRWVDPKGRWCSVTNPLSSFSAPQWNS